MLFGAHVSIAGNITEAPNRAAFLGCEVMQIFTRPPQGAAAPKLTPEIVANFKENLVKNNIREVMVHTPYYINLASAEDRIRHNSVRVICEELDRASMLDAAFCVTHMGSAKGSADAEAVGAVLDGLQTILKGYNGSARLLIEVAAGSGQIIGDTFEEMAELTGAFKPDQLGVCLDTQHVFASGYDLRTAAAVKDTLDKFDVIIGLKRLAAIHCNDSKVELGARKDRHEHLGKGLIGAEAFKMLVAEPRLQKINFYLETEHDAVEEDLKILKKFRKT